MTTAVDLVVRPRRDADLPVLLTILQRSHDQHGYPVRASAVRALLDHAVGTATGQGRRPVLLVEPAADARRFYLRAGWREIGTATQQWGEHRVEAVLMVVDVAGDPRRGD